MVIDNITEQDRSDCRDCNARQACRACKRKCFITHSSSKSAGLSFFKVMAYKFSRSLEIPSQAAEKIRSSGSCRHAVLESPSGGLWDIMLCCSGSSAFLKDGWENFVAHHSIQPQDILVFRHVLDAHFLVQIFENSGKEKQRDPACPAEEMPKSNSEWKAETKFVKGENGLDFWKLPKIDIFSKKQFNFPDNGEEESAHHDWKSKSHEVKPSSSDDLGPHKSSRKDELQFSRRIRHSAIYGSARLYFPFKFSRRWLPQGRVKVVLLCQGRKWSLNFVADGGPPRLDNSWKAFVIDNQLKINDICVFQLMDIKNYVFRVEISRA